MGYPDPTRVYYTYEQGDKWEATTDERDFMQWYDNQLHNMAEMKAIQMLMGHYDELTMGIKETEGSSSVESEWGRINSGEDNEEWKEDPWYHARESKDNGQHAESKQVNNENAKNIDRELTSSKRKREFFS